MSYTHRDISPLLTAADVELLDQLASTEDPELARLRDLVWRLSKLKVSEGYFPKYAVLINQNTCSAFSLHLAEKLPVGDSKTTLVGAPDPAERHPLLSTTLDYPVMDAVLLVRPCLRVSRNAPMSLERLAELGKLRVIVSHLTVQDDVLKPETRVDDTPRIIWDGPVADFLADEHGYGRQRQPTALRPPTEPLSGVFSSGTLDSNQHAYPADLGIFLASGTVVSVELEYPILPGEELEIHTGLVMARYRKAV